MCCKCFTRCLLSLRRSMETKVGKATSRFELVSETCHLTARAMDSFQECFVYIQSELRYFVNGLQFFYLLPLLLIDNFHLCQFSVIWIDTEATNAKPKCRSRCACRLQTYDINLKHSESCNRYLTLTNSPDRMSPCLLTSLGSINTTGACLYTYKQLLLC